MIKRYWSSDEYTLSSGEGYTGYVLIDGKSAKTVNGSPLTPIDNASAAFALSDLFKDRLLDDKLTLPYNKHQVTFAPNDFLSTSTLKAIIKRLHINNMYLYRCAFAHDTALPSRSEEHITAYTPTTTELKWGTLRERNTSAASNLATSLPLPFFSSKTEKARFDLCDIVGADIKVLRKTNANKLELLLVVVLKDRILLLKTSQDCTTGIADSISTESLLSLETIDPQNGNSIHFISLVDAKISGNSLFVLDSALNLVAKYDISALTDQDGSAKASKIFLVNSIQGKGRKTDNLYFNAPTALASSGDFLYIADNGNQCIKKFTTTLDYIKTFRNGRFATNNICSLAFNPFEGRLEDGTEIPPNSLWVLSESANHLFISILSSDKHITSFQVEGIDLASVDESVCEEHGKTIILSATDSNTFYIATTERIFKLHCSRPTRAFASIQFQESLEQIASNIWRAVKDNWSEYHKTWANPITEGKRGTSLIKCFTLTGHDEIEGDIIFTAQFTYRASALARAVQTYGDEIPSHVEKDTIKQPYILIYNEPVIWESILANPIYPCYSPEDIEEIGFSEYINTLSFNKVLFKVAQNLIQFKNSLTGRFTGFYDTDNLIKYDGLDVSSDAVRYFITV